MPANLHELESCGWVRISDIADRTALLNLAMSLGRPVASPTGEVVKEIRVTPRSQARGRTLSATYGDGDFPLHTDTAFWPIPARYVVLRVSGDTRRTTTILSFADLFKMFGRQTIVRFEQSLWLVRNRPTSFYASSVLTGGLGWRFDSACMFPANSAAFGLNETLRTATIKCRGTSIEWSGREAVVISNWRVLHGRGPAPEFEKERILERIYVR